MDPRLEPSSPELVPLALGEREFMGFGVGVKVREVEVR